MERARSDRPSAEAQVLWARLLAGGALTLLLASMFVVVLTSDGTDESGKTTTVATKPPPSRAAPPQTRKPPSLTRLAVNGIGAFDPEGDRAENDGDAALATDGNAATAWKSEHYRSVFRKSGVGLVVDAGRAVRAARLDLVTETPGYAVEVKAGAAPEGPFATVARTRTATARTRFALSPRSSRYLLVWITSMPATGVAAVNEVVVRAAG